MARKPPRSDSSTNPRPVSHAAMPPCSQRYYRTPSTFRRRRRPDTCNSGEIGFWDRCRHWAARKCWMKSTPIRTGVAEAQDSAQDVGYFEYRSVLNGRHAGTKIAKATGNFGYSLTNVFEGVQHDSGVLFPHPVGVVTLLRHGPRVSHHDDRQPLLHGFADAARTRFADEEIAELHEVADLSGKYDHRAGSPRPHRAQIIGQRGVVAADQNQLNVVQALCDTEHDIRTVPAEHHHARRSIRIELQLGSLGDT